ncbi:lysine transporter LysE [Campylobacter sp. LR264d]|uniref:LysE family transporter n=1 Tax=Campylobacter sp. LR264d TaxID=2593544 RepID=UPI001238CF06|nr:LysE family transporter [Campylobacter sp. LR264d]KAA6230105.1 lysine transporter LysE [Campylobacter sp. LR264d]
MLEALLNGLLLGFGVAVPFGPLNILILTYALQSFKNAFLLGLGAMCADMIYFLLLSFGILKFLNQDYILKTLAIFGFCFLSYIAFLMLKSKQKNLQIQSQNINERLLKSFSKGLFLNLLNPYIIGFWLSVATLSALNEHANFMFFGLILAIISWVFCLSFFVGKFSHLFTAKIIHIINFVSAIIIEYFAIMLIYKNFF